MPANTVATKKSTWCGAYCDTDEATDEVSIGYLLFDSSKEERHSCHFIKLFTPSQTKQYEWRSTHPIFESSKLAKGARVFGAVNICLRICAYMKGCTPGEWFKIAL